MIRIDRTLLLNYFALVLTAAVLIPGTTRARVIEYTFGGVILEGELEGEHYNTSFVLDDSNLTVLLPFAGTVCNILTNFTQDFFGQSITLVFGVIGDVEFDLPGSPTRLLGFLNSSFARFEDDVAAEDDTARDLVSLSASTFFFADDALASAISGIAASLFTEVVSGEVPSTSQDGLPLPPTPIDTDLDSFDDSVASFRLDQLEPILGPGIGFTTVGASLMLASIETVSVRVVPEPSGLTIVGLSALLGLTAGRHRWRRYLATPLLLIVVMGALATSPPAYAQRSIEQDFLQDGGTFIVAPEGQLTVAGSSSPTLTLRGQSTVEGVSELVVGQFSSLNGQQPGRLNISEGSVLSTSGSVKLGDGSIGEAIVSGTGSRLVSTGITIDIARSPGGSGSLSVENGATVSAQGISIASNPDAPGVLNISGAGSSVEIDRPLLEALEISAGLLSEARINITDGGRLSTIRGLRLGNRLDENGVGVLRVSGRGSRLEAIGPSPSPGIVRSQALAIDRGSATFEAGAMLTAEALRVSSAPDASLGASALLSGLETIAELGRLDVGGTIATGLNPVGSSVLVTDGARIVPGRRILSSGFSTQLATRLFIGGDVDTAGTLTIHGQGSSAALSGGSPHIIGGSGVGRLVVENGAEIFRVENSGTPAFVVAQNAGSVGHLILSGENSRINTSRLVIGEDGDASLSITDGGILSSFEVGNDPVVIGKNPGSSGIAEVTGENSQWSILGDLQLGADGEGRLLVQAGGQVEVSEMLIIGTQGLLTGDGGSILGNVSNNGVISPGNSPGTLLIDGDVESTGSILLEIGDYDDFDQLTVTGQFDAGGVLDIRLLDGFRPNPGDTFPLLQFDSFVDSGLQVSISGDNANLIGFEISAAGLAAVALVPEPSAAALIALAVVAIAGHRSRS